jgi:PAS domain S-box-containing protein
MPFSDSELSNELLQVALAQSFNAVLITNAQRSGDGPVIVYCNDALCRMTGYPREALLGQSPRILQGPKTDRRVLDRLRQCLDDARYFEGQALNYRQDGSTYWVEWNISPVRDASGAVAYYLSVQLDVTARVLAEQQRALLARALHASNDAVWITDADLVIVFANQAVELVTGYTRGELLGQKPMMLRSGMHEPAFYEELHDCLRRGQEFRGTFINQRKSGQLYYAEQSILTLRDTEGHITHYVGVSKDITDQVQREAALREQAEHDQLTGLLNRHAGEAALERSKLHALASGQSFGLILTVRATRY